MLCDSYQFHLVWTTYIRYIALSSHKVNLPMSHREYLFTEIKFDYKAFSLLLTKKNFLCCEFINLNIFSSSQSKVFWRCLLFVHNTTPGINGAIVKFFCRINIIRLNEFRRIYLFPFLHFNYGEKCNLIEYALRRWWYVIMVVRKLIATIYLWCMVFMERVHTPFPNIFEN